MADFLKNRIKREIAARQEAERILEEKSLELYFKNVELEELNKELNNTLTVTTDELGNLENINLELFENSAVGIVMTEKPGILRNLENYIIYIYIYITYNSRGYNT